MGLNVNWTAAEIEYLRKAWGIASVDHISRKLNRTQGAIRQKAGKLGLGPFFRSGEYVTLNEFYQVFRGRNFNSYNLQSWIENRGLPVHRKKRNTGVYARVIYLEEFWQWAEQNRSFLDFSWMEPNALGLEPDWVKEQRTKDHRQRCQQRRGPWSSVEDQRLLYLLQQFRYTWPEISQELGRTEGAIQRRCSDLGIKERPLRASPHAGSWTPELVERLEQGILNGEPYSVIARMVGKSEKAVRGYCGRAYGTECADKIRQIIRREESIDRSNLHRAGASERESPSPLHKTGTGIHPEGNPAV